MNIRTILSAAGLVAAIAAIGCSRKEGPNTSSQSYSPDNDHNYGKPGDIVHPDKGDPTIGGRQGRASGGGLDDDKKVVQDPASISTKDQFEDYLESRVDHLEDMLDGYKDRGDSLKGVEKDRFDQAVTMAKGSIKNVKDQMGKLDDNNWSTMRAGLESSLKKAESEVQRVGRAF